MSAIFGIHEQGGREGYSGWCGLVLKKQAVETVLMDVST
jgi:hypothetical protein